MKTCCLILALAVSATAVTPALADEARTAKPEAAASTAATPAPARATTTGEGGGAASQPRKVCRTDAVTGSRIATRRVCMTKDEWRRVDRGESVSLPRTRDLTRR